MSGSLFGIATSTVGPGCLGFGYKAKILSRLIGVYLIAFNGTYFWIDLSRIELLFTEVLPSCAVMEVLSSSRYSTCLPKVVITWEKVLWFFKKVKITWVRCSPYLPKCCSTGRFKFLLPAEIQVMCIKDAPWQTHPFTYNVILFQPVDDKQSTTIHHHRLHLISCWAFCSCCPDYTIKGRLFFPPFCKTWLGQAQEFLDYIYILMLQNPRLQCCLEIPLESQEMFT